MTTSLLGPPVAERILSEARAAVERGRATGRPPVGLVSLHRATTSPFSVYLKQQGKAAAAAGITFRSEALPPAADARILAETVTRWNADPTVHAVLLEHPLPAEMDFLGAVDRLAVEKDVDGVGPENLGRLVARRPVQVPAVAEAALAIARHYALPTAGRRVTVIGRSETVGVPLALLLLARGAGGDATVTVAHSKTAELRRALLDAELIFSCAGAPGLLDRSNVPKGATVIDVGLSTVPDPTRPSGVRIAGDADGASLDGWAGALTPVPGGVGPVTVACLMANAVRGWERLMGGSA